jgi:hypothetical protein
MIPPQFQPPEVLARNGNLSVADVLGVGSEAEANARLIAAAPELLDTLRRILAAHDSKKNGAVMGEAVLCGFFADLARDAIAKATTTDHHHTPET